MRIAVISDVHANLPALEAVLTAIWRERVDALWCLGDVVGYGPHPSRCCSRVAADADVALAGNHDLGVAGLLDLAAFSPEAAAAARWTAAVLDPHSLAWLRSLEPAVDTAQAQLVHGSPLDPVWEYVLDADGAAAALGRATRPLVLVGHSHAALAFATATPGAAVTGGLAPPGTTIELVDGALLLLNPGSVGQPRDGDPRAAWLLVDLGARVASFRRAAYDVDRVGADILAAGLPAALAHRLVRGL